MPIFRKYDRIIMMVRFILENVVVWYEKYNLKVYSTSKHCDVNISFSSWALVKEHNTVYSREKS